MKRFLPPKKGLTFKGAFVVVLLLHVFAFVSLYGFAKYRSEKARVARQEWRESIDKKEKSNWNNDPSKLRVAAVPVPKTPPNQEQVSRPSSSTSELIGKSKDAAGITLALATKKLDDYIDRIEKYLAAPKESNTKQQPVASIAPITDQPKPAIVPKPEQKPAPKPEPKAEQVAEQKTVPRIVPKPEPKVVEQKPTPRPTPRPTFTPVEFEDRETRLAKALEYDRKKREFLAANSAPTPIQTRTVEQRVVETRTVPMPNTSTSRTTTREPIREPNDQRSTYYYNISPIQYSKQFPASDGTEVIQYFYNY